MVMTISWLDVLMVDNMCLGLDGMLMMIRSLILV